MNCQSCGGPVHETTGRSRMVCTYCGSINLPHGKEMSVDRVRPTGNMSEIACPACATQLEMAFVDDLLVEYCSNCSGILLERESFMSAAWGRRSVYQGAEETPLPIRSEELRERRSCPRCQQVMDCHPYYGPGNAVIDSCHRCDLVWLDAGELTTIERAPGQRQLRQSE